MATVFWNRNIADEAHQKVKEFIAAGQDVTWIAFAPPGGNHWSVVTNQTFFNRNIPDECHQKMKEFVAAGQKIVCVAFPPQGGNSWNIVTDKAFFNRNIPDECHQKMQDFTGQGLKILCVAFPPQGGNRWSLAADKTYFNRNVPNECHMMMGEIYSTHGPMRAVAFDPDGNGWSLVSAAKNTVIYRLPFEDDDLWKLSNGNWDDPTDGHSKGNPNGLQAFAFDFTHPEGGNIRAARGGVVHALVKSESGNSWGSPDPCQPGVGNYLVIKHSDATFGVYWHMKKNGVMVTVSDTVKRGDLIASSGNTGNSSTPHLHFEVRTNWDLAYSCSNLSEFPSIRVRFEAKNHLAWIPRVGDAIESNNG